MRNKSFYTCLLVKDDVKHKIMWGVPTLTTWLNNSLFPFKRCVVFHHEKGMKCLYFDLCETVFVTKSGFKSKELRQLVACGTFQLEHYSPFSFHVCQGWTETYRLTAVIFVHVIQQQYMDRIKIVECNFTDNNVCVHIDNILKCCWKLCLKINTNKICQL